MIKVSILLESNRLYEIKFNIIFYLIVHCDYVSNLQIGGMEVFRMETKIDSRFMGIIALLGIMLIVASLFMAWVAFDINFGGVSEHSSNGTQLSELADNSTLLGDYNDWHTSAAYIVFALGIIMLILEIVSMIVPEASKKIKAAMPSINLIFGIVIIIVAGMFCGWDLISDLDNSMSMMDADVKVGAGVWCAITGAVICILCNIGQVYSSLKKEA